MKFDSLKPGMVVYDVGRRKMGNTAVSTVTVWEVTIVSVDPDLEQVVARWNGNTAKVFYRHTYRKWRKSCPLLVKSGWAMRLATREEIAEARSAADKAKGGLNG